MSTVEGAGELRSPPAGKANPQPGGLRSSKQGSVEGEREMVSLPEM